MMVRKSRVIKRSMRQEKLRKSQQKMQGVEMRRRKTYSSKLRKITRKQKNILKFVEKNFCLQSLKWFKIWVVEKILGKKTSATPNLQSERSKAEIRAGSVFYSTKTLTATSHCKLFKASKTWSNDRAHFTEWLKKPKIQSSARLLQLMLS